MSSVQKHYLKRGDAVRKLASKAKKTIKDRYLTEGCNAKETMPEQLKMLVSPMTIR